MDRQGSTRVGLQHTTVLKCSWGCGNGNLGGVPVQTRVQGEQEFSLTLCAALVPLLRRGLVWTLRDGAHSHPYHGDIHRDSSAPLGLWLRG